MKPIAALRLVSATFLLYLAACNRTDLAQVPDLQTPTACAVALAPHQGQDRVDAEISRLQGEAGSATDPRHAIERLGWMFVAKARRSHDPGYYKLAEQSALCLDSKHPGAPEGLLLRGHALHNLHRFREAEELARKLVTLRETPFDYGLLGDVLMEQGGLGEATAAYQTMLDLKPSLQSYSRAAHIRWMRGDLPGAVDMMRTAAKAGSTGDSEATAWAYSRLALYELQNGSVSNALEACNTALEFESDYPPALLARGRVLFAKGEIAGAIEPLQRAATLNPLPEYQWTLSEVLRASGRTSEAAVVEAQILKKAASDDPRTFALYLATRKEQVDVALKLAQQELLSRADVFTLDALAWSLAASGRAEEAYAAIKRALAEETQDARLFYHAGVIYAAAGQKEEAQRWLTRADEIRQMLLPSERDHLARQLTGS